MGITYHYESDLLELKNSLIVHGCNGQRVMRSGVAKGIREKYPGAYDAYYNMKIWDKSKAYKSIFLGGSISTYVDQETGNYIINMITQEFYGRDGKQYVDYNFIESGFEKIARANMLDEPVNIPLIGCGLAGGDWDIVSNILEKSGLNIHVHILDDEKTHLQNLKLKKGFKNV